MHLYIWVRGIRDQVDRMLNEISAKYLPFKFHGKDAVLQVAVRYCSPFIELTFPREHLSSLINSFGGLKFLEGQESVQFIQKYLWMVRKVMGLKAVNQEDIDDKAPIIPFYHEHSEILLVGMKEDKNMEDGTEYL